MDSRSRKKLENAVKRGVDFLDKTRPSWFTKISTKRLDIADCEVCILGQLYGTDDEDGYERGLAILNGKVRKNPEKFGFNADFDSSLSSDDQYAFIQEVWEREIAARRKARRQKRAVSA